MKPYFYSAPKSLHQQKKKMKHQREEEEVVVVDETSSQKKIKPSSEDPTSCLNEEEHKTNGMTFGFCDSQQNSSSFVTSVWKFGLFETMRNDTDSGMIICLFNHSHEEEDNSNEDGPSRTIYKKLQVSHPDLFIQIVKNDAFCAETCCLGIDFRTWKTAADFLLAPTTIFDKLLEELVRSDQKYFSIMSLFTLWCAFGITAMGNVQIRYIISRLFSKEPQINDYLINNDLGDKIFNTCSIDSIFPRIWSNVPAFLAEKLDKNNNSPLDMIPASLIELMTKTFLGQIYIAGGACIPRHTGIELLPSSDIDLFVISSVQDDDPTSSKKRADLEVICRTICQLLRSEGYIITWEQEKNVVAVAPPSKRNIQICISLCTSIQKLMTHFDLPACQWATNGVEVFHSVLSLHALHTKLITNNRHKDYKSERLVKYRLKGYKLDDKLTQFVEKDCGKQLQQLEQCLLYNYLIQNSNLNIYGNVLQLKRQGKLVSLNHVDDALIEFHHVYAFFSLDELWKKRITAK